MLTLRPYQVEAIEKIVERHDLLLALTMGAGKTATAIAAIRQLRRQMVVSHGVVLALKSTKWQWLREVQRWDPRASVQVVDGDRLARTVAIRRAQRYNYSILNYECLVNDWEAVTKYLPVDFVIADEATYIKSFTAQRSRHCKVLGKHAPVRIALSGQPVENGKPEELFSIMEFVNPGVLGGFHKFDKTFIKRDGWGKPIAYRNLDLFQQVLAPAMYRKSREDIAEWLPEMIEVPLPILLDPANQKLHDFVRNDLSAAIDHALSFGRGGGSFDVLANYGRAPSNDRMGAMGEVMSRLLAMRMLSSHPALLHISASEFDSPLSQRGSQYASALRAAGMLDNLPADNAKLTALIEYVNEIVDEDPRHKVVVFSYFKPMLRMIGAELRKRKIPWVLIDGDVTGKDRDLRIQKFNNDPGTRVFLSSDAGAYGVDLNQGSHLVCYDLPWSSGALAQRISRIDRTNSAFDRIIITYMFGAGTIEERMFNMLQQKRPGQPGLPGRGVRTPRRPNCHSTWKRCGSSSTPRCRVRPKFLATRVDEPPKVR